MNALTAPGAGTPGHLPGKTQALTSAPLKGVADVFSEFH